MTAVTVMSNAIPLGSLVASVIPSLTIKDNAHVDTQRDSFHSFLNVSNAVITLLAVPLLAVARSAPPSPPS